MEKIFTPIIFKVISLRQCYVAFVSLLLVAAATSLKAESLHLNSTDVVFNFFQQEENTPPTVDAGDNQTITLPTNTATFTATGNDADGSIASYLWTQTAGPTQATLADTETSTLGVSEVIEGTYTFQVTVTDNEGAMATDQVSLIVNAAATENTPPTVDAGGNQTITLPTNTANFTAVGEDADGDALTYSWTQTAGPTQATLANTNTATLSVSDAEEGTYTFQVTVDDGQATATDQVSLIVNAAATPSEPVNTNVTPSSICGTGNVTFSAEPGEYGDVVRWYDSETSGELLYQQNSFEIELSTTKSYWASTYNTETGAESGTVEVKAPVKENPVAEISTEDETTFCEGGSAMLSATEVEGYTYQWYREVSETATEALGTTSSQEADASGAYYVMVTSDGCTVESNRIDVTVKENPVAPTVSNQTFCSADNATVGDLPDGEGKYAWYGTLESTTALDATNSLESGTYYVTTTENGCESEKFAVNINVDPESVGGTATAEATEVCVGSGTTVNLTGEAGEIVRWEQSTDYDSSTGEGNWTEIASIESSLNTGSLSQTSYYRAVVQSGLCPEAYSSVATITVVSSIGGTVGENATVCYGSNSGTLTLSGHIGEVIRWESKTADTEWAVIENTTISQAYENLTATTQYRAVVQRGNCAEAVSEEATLSVQDPIVADFTGIEDGAIYYSGESNKALSGGSPSGGAFSGTGVISSTQGNNTTYSFSPCTALGDADETTVTVTYSGTDSNGCAYSEEKEVTVKKSVYSIAIYSEPIPYCGGQGGIQSRVNIYRDAEITYPYLTNKYGAPVDENGNLIPIGGTPVLNEDFFTQEELETLPPIIIANAWRYFRPRVTPGTGVLVNENDRQGNNNVLNNNLFQYDWRKFNGNSLQEGGNNDGPERGDASLSATDWLGVRVRQRNTTTCGSLNDWVESYRIYSADPNLYNVSIENVSGFCTDDITDGDPDNDMITISANLGYSGEDLELVWYKVGSSEPLGTTTYPDYNLTVPKSTFQDGDQVYLEKRFSTEYIDYLNDYAPGNCRPKNEGENTITINIDEPATIEQDLTLTGDELCAGTGDAVFSVAASGTDLEYKWFKVVGEVGGEDDHPISSGGNISIDGGELTISNPGLTDAGEYYVVVSNSNTSTFACTITPQTSVTANLTINSNPEVLLNEDPECELTTITANASGGSGEYTYQWTVPEGVEDPGNVSSFTTTVEGTYKVTLIDANSCSSAPAEEVITIQEPTKLTESANFEINWLTEWTRYEVLAPETAEELGEDAIYVWYRRVAPYADWGEPVQEGGDNYYTEENAEQEPEFRVEIFSSQTCTIYEYLMNIIPQPVEMIYFTAQQQGSDVLLEWATATEKNNTGFEVQVSANGKEYRRLDFVPTQGDAVRVQEYSYLDQEPGKSGNRYYRLMQVDIDGTTAFFGPKVVAFEVLNKISFYPNPFEGNIEMNIESELAGEMRIIVSDAAGRELLQESIRLEKGPNQGKLTLNKSLPGGIYFVTTQIGGRTKHFRLMKK